MYGGQIVRDRRAMDEPTIDCLRCGAHGTLELALYQLGDDAEWHCVDRVVICDDHTEAVLATARRVRHHERLIIMSL